MYKSVHVKCELETEEMIETSRAVMPDCQQSCEIKLKLKDLSISFFWFFFGGGGGVSSEERERGKRKAPVPLEQMQWMGTLMGFWAGTEKLRGVPGGKLLAPRMLRRFLTVNSD